MASLRDIKQRIKSTKSTQQITRAMNLVASSKLQRAKGRLVEATPYSKATRNLLASIVESAGDLDHPYIKPRVIKNSLIIVVTGDKGLCGAYNANVMKEAASAISERENVKVVVTGNKGVEYFSNKENEIVKYMTGMSDKPFYEDAAQIGSTVFNLFAQGEVDEVLIAYTEFVSTLTHIAKVETLLPIDISNVSNDEEDGSAKSLMEFEPKPEVVLDYILPKYVNTLIYDAMISSAACELASRTTSMDNATKNAGERIDKMTLSYNRARQGVITNEIIEIVAGADALN